MYLTVKDVKRIQPISTTNSLSNFVDALFAGTTTDVVPEPVEFTMQKLVRTKTHKVPTNTCTTNHITHQTLMMACYMINERMLKHPTPQDEYISFRIPKKTHGFREINAPKPELKKDMKEIASILENYLGLLAHDSAWAYVRGRDVVTAMKEHTKNESRWYLKLDLHDFFGSCTPEFIVRQLKRIYPFATYQYDTVVTGMLDKLASFATLDNGLPQGTPLSPILTNLIMVQYDYEINKLIYNLTKEHKLFKQKYIYTRYADDIIISAKNKFEYDIIVEAIKNLFENTPLVINEEKTRFGSNAGRNWNLGVMCNKDNNITVGHKRKQELKAIVHNYVTDENLWSLEDLRWLLGQLNWVQNVEPEYFHGLMNYFRTKYDIMVWDKVIQDIKNYNN